MKTPIYFVLPFVLIAATAFAQAAEPFDPAATAAKIAAIMTQLKVTIAAARRSLRVVKREKTRNWCPRTPITASIAWGRMVSADRP